MKKVYLFCALGMSTSVMVKKMQEIAKSQNYELEVAAYTIADVDIYGPEADMILLGPQIKFQLKKVRAQFPGKPVEAIDMRAYGTMDAVAVVKTVKEALGD